ncbi:MAG: VTT domain-containing protein [Bacteroidetes bacterium]|nr:VTT domain-containing protein [Bacteroidota bacterium]MBS1740980.1 VTT domain-containing protein [Bacteroidota bacterium]MBS1777258.1 VTT domain-containing protein [Bacteroidota bacterium]
MQDIIELVKELMNAEKLAALVTLYGGLYLVALIIFAETGLFIGFFLPGDSLLFVTGLMIANSKHPFPNDFANLLYWILLITFAGVIGNMIGYWFGKKTGPVLFEKRDTLLFKKKHVIQAKHFYEKRGGSAIILARFLPIVRTFAPIVAGVVEMDRKKFFLFNVIGCIAWVASMTLSGYFLGENEWVKHNFEKIVIGLIVVTTFPVLFKMFFSKKKNPIIEVGKDIVEEEM